MAEELLDFYDRNLDNKKPSWAKSKARIHSQVFNEPEEETITKVVASGKNKDFIEAIKGQRFAMNRLVPNSRDTMLKTNLHKKISFIDPVKKAEKEKQRIRREKEKKEEEAREEARQFQPKLKSLTSKQIENDLHLFKGAKVSKAPPVVHSFREKSSNKEKEKARSHKYRDEKEKALHDRHPPQKSNHRESHKIEKLKSKGKQNHQAKDRFDCSESSDSGEGGDFSMEVRDLFDLEEENRISYRIGEYEDRRELERLERRAEKKKDKSTKKASHLFK
jgi:hypothetical protein